MWLFNLFGLHLYSVCFLGNLGLLGWRSLRGTCYIAIISGKERRRIWNLLEFSLSFSLPLCWSVCPVVVCVGVYLDKSTKRKQTERYHKFGQWEHIFQPKSSQDKWKLRGEIRGEKKLIKREKKWKVVNDYCECARFDCFVIRQSTLVLVQLCLALIQFCFVWAQSSSVGSMSNLVRLRYVWIEFVSFSNNNRDLKIQSLFHSLSCCGWKLLHDFWNFTIELEEQKRREKKEIWWKGAPQRQMERYSFPPLFVETNIDPVMKHVRKSDRIDAHY